MRKNEKTSQKCKKNAKDEPKKGQKRPNLKKEKNHRFSGSKLAQQIDTVG